MFQTHGISYFEQDGRRIELMPGDCLAYDVSCPHTIVSPALTRHEVVIVPKALLQERGFRTAKMSACKLSARTGTGRIAYDFVHAAFDEAAKLSPNNAVGVADSLIDLLLLPLREADTMFDRGGPEAMYIRAQAFIREHLRDPGSLHRPDFRGTGLHQALSAHAVQRQGHDRQRLYLAGTVAELPPGTGDAAPARPITDVAFSWGFSSSSHFSRVFRKYFGFVPSSIHKAHMRTIRCRALCESSVKCSPPSISPLRP